MAKKSYLIGIKTDSESQKSELNVRVNGKWLESPNKLTREDWEVINECMMDLFGEVQKHLFPQAQRVTAN